MQCRFSAKEQQQGGGQAPTVGPSESMSLGDTGVRKGRKAGNAARCGGEGMGVKNCKTNE